MPRYRLTNAIVAKHSCPEGCRKQDLFDTDTKGLMLEVRANGGRTYYLRYTDRYGKTRQHRLADARDVTLTQARGLADAARNRIALGGDPAEDRAAQRQVPSFAAFAEEQYLPFVRSYKRSARCDEGLLRNHLIPRFGHKRLDEIRPADISRMMRERLDEGAAPGSVNRLTILMRYMFNLAVRDWSVPGLSENPTKGIPLLPENNKIARYLSAEEIGRLFAGARASPNRMLPYIVAFLLFTGARRNEVIKARWSQIDRGRAQWRIPSPKSGEARHVPLGVSALRVLDLVAEETREIGADCIFPNPKTGKPYVSVFEPWDKARRRAGLPHVRLHDLRHSYAAFLVNNGRSLYEIKELLGHTQISTTQRYAHLSQETLLEATNTTAPLGEIFDTLVEDHPGPSEGSSE